MINNDKLMQLERQVAEYRTHGNAPIGYPLALIEELLGSLRHQKTLKKKYQHLAEKRGQAMAVIFSAASRCMEEMV